jgi:hypothetical protein
MKRYWVIGGEFSDMTFTAIQPGKTLEAFGPFRTEAEAFKVWNARARATMDDCQSRYFLVDGDEPGRPD